MTARLVLGTVRGRRGRCHSVALRDGSVMEVVFIGDVLPRIGADVIGVLDDKDGEKHLELVPDVAKRLLKGRVRIISYGRPDLTARMLAHLLEGAAPAIVQPGLGGIIERTPTVTDPDLRWALSILEPEAARLGIALNVVDPVALAGAPWSDANLIDEVLPADSVGERDALSDLKALMADAFRPACRRTLVAIGRGAKVPSVDFVVPYSPFLTGSGFCSMIGNGWKSEFAFPAIPTVDARRLSAFREIALAFSPRHLGRVSGGPEVARQVEETFGDVAAVMAFLRSGGDAATALRFAQYREAGAARWDGIGSCPPQSHATIRAAVTMIAALDIADTESLLATAASFAHSHAPRSDAMIAEGARAASDKDAFIDIESIADRPRTYSVLESYFRKEVKQNIRRLSKSPLALARMARFGSLTTPLGFENAFAQSLAGLVDPDSDLGADDTIRPFSCFDDDQPVAPAVTATPPAF